MTTINIQSVHVLCEYIANDSKLSNDSNLKFTFGQCVQLNTNDFYNTPQLKSAAPSLTPAVSVGPQLLQSKIKIQFSIE